jgi:iron complex transport system ATP-binding protein
LIRLNNISIGYDARLLVRDLSFDQPKGSVLTVIGSNGSGKSTLLRTLHGLQPPESGEVFWDGRNLSSIDRKERTRLAAGLYGDFARVEGFSVWDLVALGRSPYTDFFGKLGKEDQERIHEAIMAVGIEGFERKQIVELSDGEFRKAMLAKMLAQDTELLILDEPTTHLDLPAALEFVSLLKDLSRSGKTIVMSTHHLALGFKLSDSMLLLDGLENWALGSPREIMEHELLCHFLKTNKIKVEDGNLFYEL